MTPFPNDRLEPGHAHGDLLVQVCATDEFATVHALRYLMAGTRETLRLRWTDNGFHRPNATPTPGHTTTRNLMGFKDGSANPNPEDAELMDRLVWIGGGDDEPSWAVGGSYMVVRVIRMFVERWDRTALLEQEKIIGRTKRTGAPLGADREEDRSELRRRSRWRPHPARCPHPKCEPANTRRGTQPDPPARLLVQPRLR